MATTRLRGRPRKEGITIHIAEGPDSLQDYVDKIRANVNYKTANKAIKASLKVGAVYLKDRMKEELPRSDFSDNPVRPPGATAGSVAVRIGGSGSKRSKGQPPHARVVLLNPYGYVYNFFHGTTDRRTSIVPGVGKSGLLNLFVRGAGGKGLGANRGRMPKIFDINQFFLKHGPHAIKLITYSFQESVNAFDLGKPPKSIREPVEGKNY